MSVVMTTWERFSNESNALKHVDGDRLKHQNAFAVLVKNSCTKHFSKIIEGEILIKTQSSMVSTCMLKYRIIFKSIIDPDDTDQGYLHEWINSSMQRVVKWLDNFGSNIFQVKARF